VTGNNSSTGPGALGNEGGGGGSKLREVTTARRLPRRDKMTPEGPESCGWSGEQAMAILAPLERLTGIAVLLLPPRKQRMVRYMVDATLSGAANLLKVYSIGVEVFDRGARFDPNNDPIVCVE